MGLDGHRACEVRRTFGTARSTWMGHALTRHILGRARRGHPEKSSQVGTTGVRPVSGLVLWIRRGPTGGTQCLFTRTHNKRSDAERKHRDLCTCRDLPPSIVGSVVECSPATRAARVRFPDDARIIFFGEGGGGRGDPGCMTLTQSPYLQILRCRWEIVPSFFLRIQKIILLARHSHRRPSVVPWPLGEWPGCNRHQQNSNKFAVRDTRSG